MGNYNYIATAIIDGALAHGTSTSDLIESSGSMENEKLQAILEQHKLWLNSEGGERADLTGAVMRDADMTGADLRGAVMRDAVLTGAVLRGADLRDAVLTGAVLRGADLRDADMTDADMTGADLRGAVMRDAVLTGAVLTGVKYDYTTIGIHDAPHGELVVWGKKSGHIVKMLVGSDVPRSCATTRKHRSASVVTLEIDGGDVTRVDHAIYGVTTIYEVGRETFADSWDDSRWDECSHGIHWFLTEDEARALEY